MSWTVALAAGPGALANRFASTMKPETKLDPARIGARIYTLEELAAAAENKRAVCVPSGSKGFMGHQGYQPAVWTMNMSAAVVFKLIRWGLHIYLPAPVPADAVAWEVVIYDVRCIVFAKTKASARMRCVRAYWDAYGRNGFPTVSAVVRRPRWDKFPRKDDPQRTWCPQYVEDITPTP